MAIKIASKGLNVDALKKNDVKAETNIAQKIRRLVRTVLKILGKIKSAENPTID